MSASVRDAAVALAAQQPHRSKLTDLARSLVMRQLAQLKRGEVLLIDGSREHRFGSRTPECDLSAQIEVLNPNMYRNIAFGGTIGAGEAYMAGEWRADDLTALIRILLRNREVMLGVDGVWSSMANSAQRAIHALNRNTRRGSERNIAAHYDLGNELYALMLDETMAYSCGIFERADATLYEASVAKFDAACRKLALQPSDHLLEIGTGWGGLAIHAAQHYGCRVTTTTISRQQFEWARERIEQAGLGERITLLLSDYRDLEGEYDKLVSIEMIEAVGADYLPTYLGKCASLLKQDGAMLLQAITLQDQLYARALKSVDFIQRYIFPGSFIPSVHAIAQAIVASTDFKIFHLQDIGPHYATTLRGWRERFLAQSPAVKRLGYGDDFIRMWDFYLCYCEGGFAERQLGDVQMLLTKPAFRGEALGY